MSSEPNIRNRVAGAVVLVSLAVIFLPLILDGKKKNQILESYIPDKPKSGEIILVNIDEQNNGTNQSIGISESIAATSKQANDEAAITIAADEISAESSAKKASSGTKETVSEDKKTTPVADKTESIKPPSPKPIRNNRPNYATAGHLVQIGSFSSRENARKLVSQLVAAKHRAYYKTGTANGKNIYRVFSGPYLNKKEAESVITAMKKIANVNPIIVTYDPVKHSQG